MTKPIAAVPALLLVAVGLWELVASQRDARSAPDDDAWDRAAAIVKAKAQPGDLIVFAPAWADPIGRMHVPVPVDMAARMDSASYARIWELSIRGAHAPEVGRARPAFEVHGDVDVALYEQTPAVVVTDLLASKPADDSRATLELSEVGFAPHRCWQIVPQPNHPATITFPQIALGTTLVGYVGLADVFKRRDLREPGTLEVHVGTATTKVSPGVDDGWVRFELPTTPGTSDVTFIASATQADRLICFAAEARK